MFLLFVWLSRVPFPQAVGAVINQVPAVKTAFRKCLGGYSVDVVDEKGVNVVDEKGKQQKKQRADFRRLQVPKYVRACANARVRACVRACVT